MKKLLFPIVCLVASCSESQQKSELDFKTELSKPLTEISGMVADSKTIWAITDKPKAVLYKLNSKGELQQEITVNNAQANDVEAVAADDSFVYIGDVGDNDGTREDRQVIRVPKSAIGSADKTEVAGEIISFRFSDGEIVDKKKNNNYDCESLLSFGDSLYLFTKRREDLQTELFSLPKMPGSYTAHSLGTFDSKGLITDAAISHAGNEVALTGYRKGHHNPFILIFSNFTGNNFFGAKAQRIELADKDWDWQVEGITYSDDGRIYFSCEQTKQVKATLYVVKRAKLAKLDKKK